MLDTARSLAVVGFALALAAACGPAPTTSPERARAKPGRGPADVVPPTALAPGACDDAPRVAMPDLEKGAGAGERIAIDVTPQPEIMCTLLACIGPDGTENGPDVCCNGCGGNYGLRRDLEFALTFTGLAGCTGMDCNYHCEPFGIAPAHAYRFVGRARYTARGAEAVYDKVEFAVEKYCRLE